MTWQVGDLALCVDAQPTPFSGRANKRNLSLLREGASYRVSAVVGTGLRFAGLAHDDSGGRIAGYRQARFRKILPDKHEDCEPDFVTLLKRSKQAVRA